MYFPGVIKLNFFFLPFFLILEDATEISLHSLSRESPYPETNIHRFLVPDKYVPWEVSWVHYAPTKKGTPRYAWWYTKPKKDFPEFLQPYVDDEIT